MMNEVNELLLKLCLQIGDVELYLGTLERDI